MAKKVSLLLIALWVGGLWVTGFSAYQIFNNLEGQRQLAGQLAGMQFTAIRYIGMACGFYLLMQRILEYGTDVLKQSYFWVIVLMLMLVLMAHFGIQPILAQLKQDALPLAVMKSAYAGQFGKWHGVSSVAYLIQCVLGGLLVLKSR